jgi:hypothetical protein
VTAGLANQYVGQLSTEVRQAIVGNVGTMVVFRLGVDDANMIAREMGVFTADEILNLDMGQAIVRAGKSSATFNIQTYPPPPPEAADPTEKIRERVRGSFTRPRKEVEEFLQKWNDRPDQQARKKSPPANPPRHDGPTDPDEDDLIS